MCFLLFYCEPMLINWNILDPWTEGQRVLSVSPWLLRLLPRSGISVAEAAMWTYRPLERGVRKRTGDNWSVALSPCPLPATVPAL